MINVKQLNRLVLKVDRLKTFYADYLIKAEAEQEVLLDGKPIAKGEQWGKDFGYGYFTFEYHTDFENPYLYVETGGVEHLLLADGKPFGMTDYLPNGKDAIFRCHKYVSLKNVPQGAKLTVEGYCSHTFYGTMPFEKKQTFGVNGYRPERVYNKISIVDIDKTLKAFIDNAELLVSYFRCMQEGDVNKIAIYRIYEELFEILSGLPERRPETDELEKANAVMEKFFESLKEGGSVQGVYAGVVGHSHLDTAWLWTVEETHHKAARTASNAVTLLKEYPEYRFIMSSVVYLDWIRKEYPALFDEIKALVQAGRFEPNGASWVECECNVTDGESIVRQFLRGKRFLKKYFGYEADVFWLPDTFGYSAALPQILRGCRVPYFLTTKLSWNDTNKFPYDAFTWKGIDGSEVKVHFNTIQSKADPEFVSYRTENRMNKHLTENVLIAYGYGDGGGGPTRDMVENAIKTQKTYPYATVEHTTVSDFMKRLEKEQLPTHEGELYLELHRGTLTTNHEIKRLNRRLEGALKDAELLSVATGDRAAKSFTDECYDVLMLNQFHDILPGTCIHEVHAKAIEENTAILARLNGYLYNGGEYYNTLGWARKESLPCANGQQTYADLDGKQKSVSLYAFEPYSHGVVIEAKGGMSFDGERVKTPYYEAIVKEGKILSLKANGRELAKGALNEICVYQDVPNLWDNWDIDADYTKKPCKVDVESCELVSCGALELRIRTVYVLAGKSRLTQDTVFYSYKPEIVFESKLDFNDDHKFIRAEFDTNLAASSYKSEIQFGYIERPTTRNTSEEQAKYEVCNHKWTDLSEPRFGMALLNEGKYGVSVCGGRMGLSLLKSGKRPDVVGETGTKYFSYAILPHIGGFTAESVTQAAYAFNRKPVQAKEVALPVKGVTAPNVVLETVKFAEEGDGVVLRLYECERSLTSCELLLNDEYSVYACDMLEENPVLLAKGKRVSLDFRQFEIKTLLLKK